MYGAPRPAFEPQSATLKNVRLLLVEDDADTREALAAVLSKYRGEVRVADCAADALAILQAWRPDVLVSDVSLPGDDGYALIGWVRALGPDAGGGTPAIAITGHSHREDRVRLIAAGFQVYLTKPVDCSELVQMVASLAGCGDADLVATTAPAHPLAAVPSGEASPAGLTGHDLRQPLFAMRLWLNLLESEIGKTVTAEGRAHIAQLRASIAAMDAMIRLHVGGEG